MTKLMMTLDEFYEKWDINVNTESNNDILFVINKNEVVKVLQDGVNIMI